MGKDEIRCVDRRDVDMAQHDAIAATADDRVPINDAQIRNPI
ncbi:hypothetical protein [Paracoccus sp. S4493]|nr:hypothetical protein [Paracoccus sp. S4493]